MKAWVRWLPALLVSWGAYRAFRSGAQDFLVFFQAGQSVLAGRGLQIYSDPTIHDRFLYAPGFAWLMSPLSQLPYSAALSLWTLLKATLLGLAMRSLSGVNGFLASLALLFIARPLFIDFQYGQVNSLILSVSVLALLGHLRSKPNSWRDFFRFFSLAILALSKLFPLPLLLVPWLPAGLQKGISPTKIRWERWGALLGLVFILSLPVFFVGLSGARDLFVFWKDALVSKGLPLESHNQSFAAFLHRYFSLAPTYAISEGPTPLGLGFDGLGQVSIQLLTKAWAFLSFAAIFATLLVFHQRSPLHSSALLIALMVLPSHLVWKPYFIFAYPLAFYLLLQSQGRPKRKWILAGCFVLFNLSGFDVVGHYWGPRLEAASLFLWTLLVMIILSLIEGKDDELRPQG